ncbi:hypothetical protein PBI_PIPP_39 [Gordonia phage Pipp]|nr:hypothetical protein PBI_PIPP_39 [Gordonia phage Pipp]
MPLVGDLAGGQDFVLIMTLRHVRHGMTFRHVVSITTRKVVAVVVHVVRFDA